MRCTKAYLSEAVFANSLKDVRHDLHCSSPCTPFLCLLPSRLSRLQSLSTIVDLYRNVLLMYNRVIFPADVALQLYLCTVGTICFSSWVYSPVFCSVHYQLSLRVYSLLLLLTESIKNFFLHCVQDTAFLLYVQFYLHLLYNKVFVFSKKLHTTVHCVFSTFSGSSGCLLFYELNTMHMFELFV